MERANRYDASPILGEDGQPVRIVITKNDIELFKLLARFPYLNMQWLSGLTGRSYNSLKTRIRELKRFGYIKVADGQRETKEARIRSLTEKLCLELAAGGIKELKPLGIEAVEKTTRILGHQAMASQIMASFQIGTTKKIRVLPWSEVLNRPETPAALFKNPHPLTFKNVGYQYDKHWVKKDVRPDGHPFALERDDGDELEEFFFVGIEADNGTEPIASSDWGRSSIERHLREYIAIAEERLYEKQFGFPHMFVPFIFSERARMNTAISVLQHLDAHARAKRIFLFATHDPNPNGYMISRPWHRFINGEVNPFSFTEVQ